jgi:hypothetical protein
MQGQVVRSTLEAPAGAPPIRACTHKLCFFGNRWLIRFASESSSVNKHHAARRDAYGGTRDGRHDAQSRGRAGT